MIGSLLHSLIYRFGLRKYEFVLAGVASADPGPGQKPVVPLRPAIVSLTAVHDISAAHSGAVFSML